MHGKFIQITSAVSTKGMIILYALDESGRIWEKIVADQGGTWTQVLQ
jgi:hypothetical protein